MQSEETRREKLDLEEAKTWNSKNTKKGLPNIDVDSVGNLKNFLVGFHPLTWLKRIRMLMQNLRRISIRIWPR